VTAAAMQLPCGLGRDAGVPCLEGRVYRVDLAAQRSRRMVMSGSAMTCESVYVRLNCQSTAY
jgi:hypothetical protein